MGGLKALDDFLVGRKIIDFDVYVGLSAGSILAVSLAGGVPPDEMIKVLEGTSGRLDQLRPLDFYSPNWREFVTRPAKFSYDLLSYLPGVAWEFVESLPKMRERLEKIEQSHDGGELPSYRPIDLPADEFAALPFLCVDVERQCLGVEALRGAAEAHRRGAMQHFGTAKRDAREETQLT